MQNNNCGSRKLRTPSFFSAAWLLLVASLLAGGCAQVPRVSDPGRAKIDTVVIDHNVPVPDQLYYLGPGLMPYMAFGLIGAVVAQSNGAADAATAQPAELLKQHIKKNGIEMDKIAYSEVDAGIKRSGKFKVLDAAPAPAPNVGTLKISVLRYGFSIPNGFSSRLVPLVIIKCDLVDSDGKVVWSENDRTRPLGNPVESISPEEMRDNPKLIDDAWHGASHYIIDKIMGGYVGNG